MSEPKLDLILLDTHNTYTLAIGDISIYPTGFNITNPTLVVTPPSFPPVNLGFQAKNVSIFNAFNLGLCPAGITDNIPLPDGIYKLEYSIYPHYKYNVEKTFIKTDVIQEKFDKAFLQTDIMQCDAAMRDKDARTLQEINFSIQGAIASANSCANKLAMELYRQADKQLENFIKNRCYC